MRAKKQEQEPKVTSSVTVTKKTVRHADIPAKLAKQIIAEYMTKECGFEVKPEELSEQIESSEHDYDVQVLVGFHYGSMVEEKV